MMANFPKYVRILLIAIGAIWSTSVLLAQLSAAEPPSAVSPDPADMAAQIDRLLAEEVLSQGADVADPADDETFLRRAWLDLVGDLPTPEQITAFVLDLDPAKRAATVDRLLADPHYGQNWARYWRDVILYRRVEDRALMVANPLVVDLREALNESTPWDELARRFITATGDIRQNGSTAIIAAQDGNTEGTAGETTRIFLGVQIQCAQCHDHPYDSWSREQFHELAAFFPRVALRSVRSLTQRSFEVVGDDNPRRRPRKNKNQHGTAEHTMPDLENPTAAGTVMKPAFFLTGEQLPLGTDDATRRETLADWMIESEWFSKALVNRIWAELIGEGFYEPVDDIGPERSATAPRTLEYLADGFVAARYDLKWLFRSIMATEAYQRESRSSDHAANSSFAASRPQRLRSDVLYNAMTSAIEFDPAARRRRGNRPGAANSGPRGHFQQTFGYDPSTARDEITGSIPQALSMMNAPLVQRQINGRDAGTMLGRLLQSQVGDEAVVVELYLRCLAREPKNSEVKICLSHVRKTGDRREAFEDILWALLNSTEFLHRR